MAGDGLDRPVTGEELVDAHIGLWRMVRVACACGLLIAGCFLWCLIDLHLTQRALQVRVERLEDAPR